MNEWIQPVAKELTRDVILSDDAFTRVRTEKQKQLRVLRRLRRTPVGPHAMFYFECFETLWWQVQEMLRIEQGGEEQLADELSAYQPLMPRGQEWVATLMFEILDANERRVLLAQWGHIEQHVSVRFGPHSVAAQNVDDLARTTEDGKTSAVHFLRFPFSSAQIDWLKRCAAGSSEGGDAETVNLHIDHPHYHHKSTVSSEALQELVKDLS